MKFLGHVPSSIVNPSLLSVTGLRDSAGPAYTYPTLDGLPEFFSFTGNSTILLWRPMELGIIRKRGNRRGDYHFCCVAKKRK